MASKRSFKDCFARQDFIFPALLLIVCIFAYFNSLFNKFMLDDYFVLFGQQGVANKTLGDLFTDYQVVFYRPIGHVFLWFCYRLFAENPSGYHAANLFLFIIIIQLFYSIIKLLTNNCKLAFLTCLFYSIHPINSMLINYVTANVISTYVIMQQASLLFFLYALKSSRRFLYYCLSVSFFALSLLSYEMSIVFPVYLICIFLFLNKAKGKLIQSLGICVPYVFLSLLYYWFRLAFFTHNSLSNIFKRIFSMLPDFLMYLTAFAELVYWYISKLFYPRDIIFLWSGAMREEYNLMISMSFIGLMAIISSYIFLRWKKGPKAFGLAFFTAGFIPVLFASFSYVPVLEPIIEPHWFYFSSIGIFLFISSAILESRKKMGLKVWSILLTCLLLGNFIILTKSNLKWRDEETYCRYWLSLNQKNLTPYYGLGRAMMKKGRYEEAIDYFNRGIAATGSRHVYINADLGYAELMVGHKTKAKKYFLESVMAAPSYAKIYHYFGQYYLVDGEFEKAEQSYRNALYFYPKNLEYQRYLSLIQGKKYVR